MKIYVLGSKGMLGRYVMTYLKDKYEVIGITRNQIDASNINEEGLNVKLSYLGLKDGDVVINCIGTIKPQIDALGDLNGIQVNSVFPRLLANICEKLNVNLIHPTSDCVFTGLKGKYNENDTHDISDVYGRTKSLGEPNNCSVIRTSIIGEEVGQGRSLVEWIKSSSNTTVFGFTNHYWNGMTCLEFAKVCEKIIRTNGYWKGVRHLHSNTLNKKELVETISEVYELNITVTPKETPVMCDRSITTMFSTLDLMLIPTLEQQIKEMKKFSEKLYSND